MIVSRIMTENPFTIEPSTSVTDAQALMRREKIHRLPVMDKRGALVGIVSEKDLLYASPSPASTLNVYEMTNLLSKLKVETVMTRKPLTANANDTIEDAARLMSDNNIGGLPVLNDAGKLVGIITESDIFRVFIDLFGIRKPGIRATFRIPERPGEIADLGKEIGEAGGNIVSLGTWPGNASDNSVCVIKVEGLSREAFLKAVEPSIIEVMDIRET
ncbi:MAG: CBS domain-containing protein [Spirochaetaceae bacterium]|nr:MAG: CBS domain-containing protein [Spirochaetaceae bacterium]